jgi:hypothetical protein
MNQTVFLAGSVGSDWRRRIRSVFPDLTFYDPRETELTSPAEYRGWNLFWLSRATIVFAYMERDNPSGYGLALEIGYAKAQGKFVILVDERSSHDGGFSDRFALAHAVADVSFADLQQGIEYLKVLTDPGKAAGSGGQ